MALNLSLSDVIIALIFFIFICAIVGGVSYFGGRRKFSHRNETLMEKTERILSYIHGYPIRQHTFTLDDVWQWLERREWNGCTALIAKVNNINNESLAETFDLDFNAPEIHDKYLVVYIKGLDGKRKDSLLVKYDELDSVLEKTFDENGAFTVKG